MSRVLCLVMFVSGASALLFETLWFRQAGLAFGNSVWASSLVLAGFMAGLALGNGLVARFGARIGRPLRFYGALEAGIGISGVALVFALPLFGGWLAPVWRPILAQSWLLNPLRLLLGFAMLVVPATAMGATLPVLVKALRARDPSFGSVLGRLYGWNTLGAVVGSVAGEVALIGWLGIRGTAFAAAGLNAAACATAIAVSHRFEPGRRTVAAVEASPPVRLTAPVRRLLAAAFLSGGILLALEVVWFRFLRLFVSNTRSSFALVLAVVLAGIGLGGAFTGGWLRREPRAFRHATLLALLAGAATAAAYLGFAAVIAPYESRLVRGAADILWLSAALMFPVSLLSGMLFTFTGAALDREVAPETRAAGWLTLANTIGAGLGALAAGFVLLTSLGVERSVFLLSALYGAVAWLLLVARAPADPPATPWPRRVAIAAFALALAFFPLGRMEREFIQTVARRMPEAGAVVAAMREGRTETVLFLRSDLYGEPGYFRLVTSGFGMASTTVWARRYMKQFVYWPVALHPHPDRALLISFGIGNTAKALTDTRSLTRIDVVDISRDVLEMSDVVYPDPQEHPLRDPRVRVHVEDGRFFLLTTEERYDIITSEPPPPKHAGIVNLYTREHFQLIYDRLADGGFSTYWLPVHSLLLADTKAIIRAYCDVFADCSLWAGAGYNWMLAGSRHADWRRDEAAFALQWSDPRVAPELRALGFEKPEQLGATFLADASQLRRATRDVLPLVDDFPKRLSDSVDFRRLDADHGPWMDAEAARERFRSSAFIRQAWPAELRRRTLAYFVFQRMIDQARELRGLGPTPPGERVEYLHIALTQPGLYTLPLWWLAIEDNQLRAMDRHLANGGSRDFHRFRLGARALAEREFDAAARHFEKVRLEGYDPKLVLFLRLYALCMAGRADEAQALARDRTAARALDAGDQGYLDWLAQTFAWRDAPVSLEFEHAN